MDENQISRLVSLDDALCEDLVGFDVRRERRVVDGVF